MDVKKVIRVIDYAKYAVAGAIGGLAIINTVDRILGSAITESAESIAMAAGATLLAGLVKVFHVV
jgi:hypothetical protein